MSTVSIPAYALPSWSNHLHRHRTLVDPIICRISVPHPTGISTYASCHGHLKPSQVCLRCSFDNVVAPSFFERVSRNHTFVCVYTH
jgi:hypothetical protein